MGSSSRCPPAALLAPACALTTLLPLSLPIKPTARQRLFFTTPPSVEQYICAMMALRLAVFLFASLLIVSAKVASDEEEQHFVDAAYAKPPAAAASPPAAAPPAPRLIKDVRECGAACDERCKLHSRKNVCGRACATCCSWCKCVPPGTYGHTELCGKCYTDWKTHGNRTKCP